MNKKIGIILGSGLGKFADLLEDKCLLFSENDSFHKMKILSGKINAKDVIIFSGRRHFYEGYNPGSIVEFVNKAHEYGINLLIISNAAGGLNINFKVSDLMLITSHLNFLKSNFYYSPNLLPYDVSFSDKLIKIAISKKINLKKGTYCCFPGPNYETRSEINYLKKFGFDAVGMSTVPEVLHANAKGIKTIAISCITNLLSVHGKDKTDHSEVIEAGKSAYKNFSEMILAIIENSENLIKTKSYAD